MTNAEVRALCARFDGAGLWRVRQGGKPHDVCLFGIRGASRRNGAFDDAIGALVVKPDGALEGRVCRGTTDPGRGGAGDNLHRQGVACMVPGQYRGLWTIGVHARGRANAHRAFVQTDVPVRVWRDTTDDGAIDTKGKVYTDARGINLHRASRFGSERVGDWSHGCQVVASPIDFVYLLALADMQVSSGLGRTFTYTLLEADGATASLLPA